MFFFINVSFIKPHLTRLSLPDQRVKKLGGFYSEPEFELKFSKLLILVFFLVSVYYCMSHSKILFEFFFSFYIPRLYLFTLA